MNALLDVILPVFLVIGAGYVAARWMGLSTAAVDGVMKFAQTYAVPCLLFSGVSVVDFSTEAEPGLFLSFYIGAFSCFFLGFFGALYLFKRSPEEAVAIGFACLFSNSMLLGVPITERAYGAESLAGNFSIIAVHSPLFFTFGIIAMELASRKGRPPEKIGVLFKKIGLGIVKQPLVIGVMSGLAVNLSGISLPSFLTDGVKMIASAGIPAALFGLGGILLRYKPEGDMKAIFMVCFLSVIIHPLIAYILARYAFDLNINQLRSAVLTASMAPGVNAYLFADLYGKARRVSASAVLIGTAASIFTIWAWLHILP